MLSAARVRQHVLTGKYPHNHHVVNNTLEETAVAKSWLDPGTEYFPSNSQINVWLSDLFAGKYLNEVC